MSDMHALAPAAARLRLPGLLLGREDLQPAQDKPQGPRKGFEELLPEDWRGGDEGEQPPSPAAGPLAAVGTAVAEHSWKPEEEGDLALTEGETIEVLSTTEPGSGWWSGRRQCLS